MNANEPMLNEFAGRNTAEVIRMLNETIRQQQAENEKLNAEWVQAAMALGACVQENHSLKAEIEALKEKLNEAIDAEKDRRFE